MVVTNKDKENISLQDNRIVGNKNENNSHSSQYAQLRQLKR